MLNRRQIDVQYHNLSSMCRLTVKSLIDYACVNTHVDEDCEEFVNFCAVFEQMVAHRLRPYQKKVWHRGQGLPRHFWEVMLDNNRQGPLFRSCIPNIEAIESIKSSRAKLRAFVRVALMEKRLSDYLQWLQNNRSLMDECYLDGALFTSEEGLELCGDIIGLSAIDFNFCLRGNENELLGPLEINYVPFLNYTQCPASRLIDEEEMLQLSGKTAPDNLNSQQLQPFNDDRAKLQSLEKDFRGVKEQKDYLEELVRLRERQTGEANLRVEALRTASYVREREWEADRRMLDACVLELQDEISTMRDLNNLLKSQVSELQLFKSRLEFRDVQMVDLACVASGSSIDMMTQGQEDGVGENRTQNMHMLPVRDSSPTLQQTSADQKSILSGISDQIRLKEDSQSLVPLTGSLADVNIAMLRDNQPQTDETPVGDWKRAGDQTGSVSTTGGHSSGVKVKDGFVDVELTLFETTTGEQESQADTTETPPTSSITGKAANPASGLSTETSNSSKTYTSTTISPSKTTTSPLSSSALSGNTTVERDATINNNYMGTGVGGGSGASNLDESYVVTEAVVLSETDASGASTQQEKNDESAMDNITAKGFASAEPNKKEQNELKEKGEGEIKDETVSHVLQDMENAFDANMSAAETETDTSNNYGENQERGDTDTTSLPLPEDGNMSSSSSSSGGSGGDEAGGIVSSMSDPEIVDKVNTSSEGSDAAWELVSDPDESDK